MEHRNSLRVGILSTYSIVRSRQCTLVAGCSWIFQFLRQRLPVRRRPEALENVDHIGIRADQDARLAALDSLQNSSRRFFRRSPRQPVEPLNILFTLGFGSTGANARPARDRRLDSSGMNAGNAHIAAV